MIALMNGHSLTPKSHFRAEKFALNLAERQSTATLTIGSEAPTIRVDDWIRDEEDPGKGIVWRVKSVDTAYETNTRTIQLEHTIQTLRDRIMFGEVKPATMAGKSGASTCTALQAVAYILKQQGDWTIGSVGYTKSAPYNFNSEDLYSALETVSSSLLDAWWSYDFSSYPFKLSIKPKSTAVACEMRTDRNIRTLKKTIDRTRMITRFYPIGKNNLKLGGGGYVEKNTNLYGVVSKCETDNEKDTQDKLKAWANEKLNNHAEPIVTVTVSGLDLSAATGEKLDRLTLGTVCNIPLPEFDTVITERITKLSWSDKIADPESVTITLANQADDVASIINNIQKSGSASRKSAAKKEEEDHAWFVDTTDHVGMVAEAVAGKGASKDWSRVASVMVDGNGISQRVTKTENDVVTAQSKISQTESSISQVVTAVGKDGKVTAASICTAIENGGSAARISADHIILTGNTTINDVMTVASSRVYIKKPLRVEGDAMMRSLTLRGSSGGITLTDATMLPVIKAVQISGPTNNTYKLQYKTLSNNSWTDAGTFSRAVASWDESWSGGNFRVKAQPQNQEAWTAIVKGTESWSGRTVTIPIVAYNSNAPGTQVSTGYSVSATYTASKSDISCTRSLKTGEPSADAQLTHITVNGWYVFTVNAAGCEKTYKIHVEVE